MRIIKRNDLVVCVFTLTASLLAATPMISNVTAQQRYPWNGKVDISYVVTGDIEEVVKQHALLVTSLKVEAIDMVANTTNRATALSGDMGLSEGTHSFVWDMDAEGLSFKSSNVVFRVACEVTNALYCVINLSDGANALSYPVTYLVEPPSGGFNKDEYKTTKLVLRRIEAGTFVMGGDQTDESHRVTLTKPFFCGIFEVTGKQYELVNSGSSYQNNSGVSSLSWNTIRGDSAIYDWPSSTVVSPNSFIGRLQTRTGLNFDLPTEAQWEYACRAGTTTSFSCDDTANLSAYMWYWSSYYDDVIMKKPSMQMEVGQKLPNPWGLYDMHGYHPEWCLDWYSTLAYGQDPSGAYAGTERVIRGGGFSDYANTVTSYSRAHQAPSSSANYVGFRLVITLDE